MIYFILGFITAMLFDILVITTLLYFKKSIEHRTDIIEKQISSKGPKPTGFIIDPVDEAEEVRQEIIEENRKKGRDTPLQDLM